MPSLNMSVQKLKVAIPPLDVPCSRPVTHSREDLTTGKSNGKKPDRFSFYVDLFLAGSGSARSVTLGETSPLCSDQGYMDDCSFFHMFLYV